MVGAEVHKRILHALADTVTDDATASSPGSRSARGGAA